MNSIEIIKIPGGWAAHCRKSGIGISGIDRIGVLHAIMKFLNSSGRNPDPVNGYLPYNIPGRGEYLFKNFSDSFPADIHSRNSITESPE